MSLEKASTLKLEWKLNLIKKIAFHQSNSETRQEKEDFRGASNESYLYS